MDDSLLLWLVSWLVRASCMKLYALGNTPSLTKSGDIKERMERLGSPLTLLSRVIYAIS